jgi:hypothetical protein
MNEPMGYDSLVDQDLENINMIMRQIKTELDRCPVSHDKNQLEVLSDGGLNEHTMYTTNKKGITNEPRWS